MDDSGSLIPEGSVADRNSNWTVWSGRFEPQEKRRQLTNTDPAHAAQRLYERIRDAGMTVRRQQLQRLQSDRGSDNEDDNEQHTAGVSQAERKSHQRKCRETFKLRAGKHRTSVYRRQRRVDDESECQPACKDRYPLNHPW